MPSGVSEPEAQKLTGDVTGDGYVAENKTIIDKGILIGLAYMLIATLL